MLALDDDGVTHTIDVPAGTQLRMRCGRWFYKHGDKHLWQKPPTDHGWCRFAAGNHPTCLGCIGS